MPNVFMNKVILSFDAVGLDVYYICISVGQKLTLNFKVKRLWSCTNDM